MRQVFFRAEVVCDFSTDGGVQRPPQERCVGGLECCKLGPE
jgi:hypothetical protein